MANERTNERNERGGETNARTNERNESLTTGDVARILSERLGEARRTGGYSRQAVRRLIEAGELTAAWSRSEVTEDVNGKAMRGHRRVTRASVDDYVGRQLEAIARRAAAARDAGQA